MPHAEPPRIVLEAPVSCDAAAFAVAAASSAAPGPGWRVEVRVARRGNGLQARGVLVGPQEEVAATRTFQAASCDALARAIGVWIGVQMDATPATPGASEDVARGVLDAPSRRSRPEAPDAAKPSTDPRAAVTTEDARGEMRDDPARAGAAPAASRARGPRDAAWDEVERSQWERARGIEVGAATTLLGGAGLGVAGALVGAAAYVGVPLGDLWTLRPSVGAARLVGGALDLTLVTARADACARVRGRYAARIGVELEVCGGAEGGGAAGAARGGLAAVGPAAAIRADAGALVTELRADVFVAIARPDGLSAPLGARLALGVAWGAP